ncbi:MAG: LUD domain-containing protein [Thermomicrobiales bacterium]|nr:LUD domain-containing protein [Thermomicrobiales bacterium]
MSHNQLPFSARYDAALQDAQQSTSLTNFQTSWRTTRDAQFKTVGFDEQRAKMKAAKQEAIDNLDLYLSQFITAARNAGTQVHIADTAEDATRIIREIARDRGIKLVAKSKSMVSEEIFLNEALAEDGVEAIETDLGEWIVQLRHERPSHMVMPAIHLSRQQVGEVFTEHFGREISREDVTEQVHVARDAIRDVFFHSGMGITGANALIAESGTVMMVTNEGNGRLTSSIPAVHVVLAGIEKLVPTYEDAMTQVRLLARNATSQRITVYTTFIQGPTPGHEQHIVLVDNSRRKMRSMPEFRDALHCIRCAACANVCPPYREVGGHVFGHVYTGAIGLVVTPFLHSLDDIAEAQSLCLSCNACETVCPVDIPLPRQILDVRDMVVQKKGLKRAKRVVLKAYTHPNLINTLFKIGAVAQKPIVSRNQFIRLRRLPIINKQTTWRSFPKLAESRLGDNVIPVSPVSPIISSEVAGTRVAIFPGCMTDRLYPEQGKATLRVLNALGVDAVYPPNLHCCGLIPFNSGDVPDTRSLALRTLEQLEALEVDTIISPNASCVAMLAQDYLHLFRNDPDVLPRAQALAGKIMDTTSYLVKIAKIQPGALVGESPREVTYHDSCQGHNALGLASEPRYLIEQVMGDRIVEMPETICCGFGGSFSIEQPRLARRLLINKLDQAEATGTRIIVTDNQGCIMHLRGGIDAEGRVIEVKHILELMADRLPQPEA